MYVCVCVFVMSHAVCVKWRRATSEVQYANTRVSHLNESLCTVKSDTKLSL